MPEDSGRRWIALAASVLAAPEPALPLREVASALGRDLHASVVWTAAVDGPAAGVTSTWVGALGCGAVRRSAVRPFVDSLDGAGADAVRVGPQDGPAGQASTALLGLPLGAAGVWLVVGRARPFTLDERTFARTVHALLVGLAHHVELLAEPEVPGPGRRGAVRPGAGHASAPTIDDGVTPDAAAVQLTGRERTILGLMSQGLISAAIGRRLGVSPRTVTKHQEHIYRKLDASDRLSAVLRAQQAGLLDPDDVSAP